MRKKLETKDMVLAGMLLALGIVLPIAFHSVGFMGKVFLPMHIPVLLGGFLLPPQMAFVLGVITPLLSSILTGMPIMFPMAIIMMFELGIYGLSASIAIRKFKWHTISALIFAMICGRITAGGIVFFLIKAFGVKMNPMLFVKGATINGMVGILIQLICIPTFIYSLKYYQKRQTASHR